jgi:co-chaperonin GroES (HSP10)
MKLPGDKVLIQIIEPAATTAAGLFILRDKQQDNEGVVLDFGPRVSFLSIGDKVRHYKGCGTAYEYEGKKCLFLKKDEIELVL